MNTLLYLMVSVAHAGTLDSASVKLPDPLHGATLSDLIAKIFNFAAFKAGPIVVTAFVLVGAYQMIFSGGEAEKFTTGKKTIMYTVIGYVVLLMATAISNIIQTLLSV